MNKKYEARQLISKYHQGTATPEERLLVEQWFLIDLEESDVLPSAQAVERADQKISSNLSAYIQGHTTDQKVYKLWPRIASAAAILLVLGSGIFFYTSYYAPPHLEGSAVTRDLLANDIKPGSNKATLTLSNGSTITLTDAANGTLAKQSGVQITKTANGQLIYSPLSLSPLGRDAEGSEGEEKLNTISTPRGGQYQVRLPDGSKVWLNAASKLTYPVTFNGREDRRVELSGEAYFEIAKDKQHPFIVKSNGQEVQVLGTHFNINSYADEASIKTTLLEGSVKVLLLNHPASLSLQGRGGKAGEGGGNTSLPTGISPQSGERGLGTILKPGEQSLLTNNNIKITEVNTAEIIAWKNGDFIFKTQDFKTIMRQIARWYDVDIIYDPSAPTDIPLGGQISRSKNISAILKIIEATGDVHFKIEGRIITVTK